MDILLTEELKVLHQNCLPNLDKKHLKASDISHFISHFRELENSETQIIGHSFLNYDIDCFRFGNGPIKILLWSQMHGDESTATAALLDLMSLFTCNTQVNIPTNWRDRLTLYIVPMLNPDGAQIRTRENAQGIDINRDALALQTPEGQMLTKLVEELKPHYAFNLHDQHDYYRCGSNGQSATIAFLAPAFDEQKTVNSSRQLAMGLIAEMAKKCERLIPQGLARYDDEYSPRSFGDQIAAKGISTILIESGHYVGDERRQVARTLNVFVLLHAFSRICEQAQWDDAKTLLSLEEKYWQIPENQENNVCDILLRQISFAGNTYTTDIAIRKASRFQDRFLVHEIGDLHQMYGIQTIEPDEYSYAPGIPYLLKKEIQLSNESYIELLNNGYSHFVGDANLITNNSDYETILNPTFWHDDQKLTKGIIAAGFLCKNQKRTLAILNGQIISL